MAITLSIRAPRGELNPLLSPTLLCLLDYDLLGLLATICCIPASLDCVSFHTRRWAGLLVVDPIDGRNLLAQGHPGAIAVAAVAPREAMWSPAHAVYMEKIVVDRAVAGALVAECMDAPAAWTLALVARVKQKEIRNLVVFVLDRTRHAALIEEIRQAGARVMLRTDGDIAGALMTASPGQGVDLLLGVGGVPEGVIAACAVKALGGAMLGRLAPERGRACRDCSRRTGPPAHSQRR